MTGVRGSTPHTISRAPEVDFRLVRDLVTDVFRNYHVSKQIPPFTPREGVEWLIDQADVDRMATLRKCIECFFCQDLCHVLGSTT